MEKRDPIRTAFCRSRCAARFRGESWDIKFDEYRKLWHLAGGFHLRGKRMTDLIMYRLDRSKGWELSNVRVGPRQESKLAGGRPVGR